MTSSSRSRSMPGFGSMKMGGFGKLPFMRSMTRKAPPVFDMTGSQKATLVNTQQASPYGMPE
jgi:hypothetical protein